MSEELTPGSGDGAPPENATTPTETEAVPPIEVETLSSPAESQIVTSVATPAQSNPPPAALPAAGISPLLSGATPAGIPTPVRVRYRRQLGRLKAVTIKNYRAFQGPFELTLPGAENALIYGENGAGKSSLFHTIRDFFEAPYQRFRARATPEDQGVLRAIRIADNQHRPTAGEPSVELSFELGTYAWTGLLENDERRSELATPWNALITSTDKAKGFLDYRALLRVHYSGGEPGQRIDIFSLLIYDLLPHYTYSHPGFWLDSLTHQWRSGERSFSQGWAELRRRHEERLGYRLRAEFEDAQKAFDEALRVQVETHLANRASELARHFDPMLNIAFKVVSSQEHYGPKSLEAPKVYLYVLPNGDVGQVIDYDRFFNEARLTAVALAIFFAALLQSPARGLSRLLALDDILIGLDMANRLTVLRILEDYFRDWQVLIFTYHKAWFEILKERTSSKNWRHKWKHFIVRQESIHGSHISFVKIEETGQMLALAERYAARGEYKSAAVHARTAMEMILGAFCARKRLPVCYVQESKRQTNHHFLNAIHAWLSRLRSPLRYAYWLALATELKHSLRFVLHSYSHNSAQTEDELEGEVTSAIGTVRQIGEFFRAVRESELAPEAVPDEHRTFQWLIEEALTTPIQSREGEVLRSLTFATESLLLDELTKRGITVRLLEEPDLWKMLFRSGTLTKSEKVALAAMRTFLNKVMTGVCDDASIGDAARCLLQRRLLNVLRK